MSKKEAEPSFLERMAEDMGARQMSKSFGKLTTQLSMRIKNMHNNARDPTLK